MCIVGKSRQYQVWGFTSWSAVVVACIIMVCVYVYEDQLGSQNRVQVSDLISTTPTSSSLVANVNAYVRKCINTAKICREWQEVSN